MLLEAIENDENIGYCVTCGAEAYGVELDACSYPCDSCGKRKVYGAETLLLMRA